MMVAPRVVLPAWPAGEVEAQKKPSVSCKHRAAGVPQLVSVEALMTITCHGLRFKALPQYIWRHCHGWCKQVGAAQSGDRLG